MNRGENDSAASWSRKELEERGRMEEERRSKSQRLQACCVLACCCPIAHVELADSWTDQLSVVHAETTQADVDSLFLFTAPSPSSAHAS